MVIHRSKGWQRRIVPLTPSTIEALREYELVRDCHEPTIQSEAFFLLDHSRPLDISAADYAFGVLREKVGLSLKINGRRPRLYDLRHTFICKRVLTWYEAGENVDRLIPQLSRYLGHKKVSDTYWYISSIPALMACAAERFAKSSLTAGGPQ